MSAVLLRRREQRVPKGPDRVLLFFLGLKQGGHALDVFAARLLGKLGHPLFAIEPAPDGFTHPHRGFFGLGRHGAEYFRTTKETPDAT